jgi:C4-type Zn-finger protein
MNEKEVTEMRKEKKLTWHECPECGKMELIPTEIHGCIPHYGGIAKYKENVK